MGKLTISEGDTWGTVKILSLIEKGTGRRNDIWKCQCSKCGNIFSLRGRKIVSSREHCCPFCNPRKQRYAEGQTVGKIEILSKEPPEKPRKDSQWICKCLVCGNTFQIKTQQIMYYRDYGCPDCVEKEKDKEAERKARAHIGERFGQLEILDFVCLKQEKSCKRKPLMLCRCTCGNEVEVPLHDLRASSGVTMCPQCHAKNLTHGQMLLDKGRVDGSSVYGLYQRNVGKNSTTGITGVSYRGRTGQYETYINFKGIRYYLGGYAKLEDAAAARKTAEKEIFGDFLAWYAKTYPDRWEEIKKRKEQKKGGK